MSCSHCSHAVTLYFLLLSAPLAHAEWARVVTGPIDRLAASSTHVAAVAGDRVWLFGDDGAPVGMLTLTPSARMAARRDTTSARSAEDILDRHDVSVLDRDSDWAFELVDDERTLAQRRAAATRGPARPDEKAPRASVAASQHALWITAGRVTWQVDANGHTHRMALGAAQRLVAVSDTGPLLATSDGLSLQGGDGAPLRTLALPPPFAHAAVSSSGTRIAWSSGQSVEWLAAEQRGSLPSAGAVRALIYCGETLLVLTGDSVVVLPPDGPPASLPVPRHARRWFCSADRARPWLAVGQQLGVSVDEGKHWSAVVVPAGAVVSDAVATAHHVWLATSAGLFVSSAGQAARSMASAPAPITGRRHAKALAAWLSWLPTVSVQAMTRMAAGKHEVEALAIAQIPLEPRRLPILHTAFDEAATPLPTPTLRTQGSVEPRDPDRNCLDPTRRKAVELALAEPARAESFVARAAHAAWLPELRLLVSRRYGRSESLDLATSSSALSSPLGIDTVNDIRYEARATWDLGKLVFSTEELAAQNQALHMAELRRDIENTVNRLYFERRRLTVEPGGAEPWTRQVRVREIEAELDALSAGAFGACIAPKP